MTKTRTAKKLPPISTVRQAIFDVNKATPEEIATLHQQTCEMIDQACNLFGVQRTGDDEQDGNTVLSAHFEAMHCNRERKHALRAADALRQNKRDQRHNNPSITFPVEQWQDFYGENVKVGDSIVFMTLYGRRVAVVRGIEEDIDYRAGEYGVFNPVVFIVDPWQPEGFEHVFQPVTRIDSQSTYAPRKYIGRERTAKEIEAACKRVGTEESWNQLLERQRINRERKSQPPAPETLD